MPEPHQNRAAQEAELASAREKQQRIALAYHRLFSREGARTPDQQIVMQDMEERGTVYSGAISIAATTTLKAIAYKTGLTSSAVISATFTITDPPASPLTFTALTVDTLVIS